MIPAALAYIGTPRITASGTAYHLSADKNSVKKFSGTYPCIAAPIPIPIITYSKTLRTISQPSEMMVGSLSMNGVFSPSHFSFSLIEFS
jgi:hypothetical protein